MNIKPKIKEVSAGAILFRNIRGSLEFLLLKNRMNIWEFAKGHLQYPDLRKSALTEIIEETGIQILDFSENFITSYKYTVEFSSEISHKTVYLFLHEAKEDARLSNEHSELLWLNKSEAFAKIKFAEQREALEKAITYIQTKNLHANTRR